MLEVVETPVLYELQERVDKFNEEFDDFNSAPCPQEWDRFMR
jgi:hypothetical protein